LKGVTATGDISVLIPVQEPLMKTCGEGKPRMAALLLLLLLGARLRPINFAEKMAAPLAAPWGLEEADAISDYVCTLKNCKRVWKEETNGGFLGGQDSGNCR
jgi:hypothetical protein